MGRARTKNKHLPRHMQHKHGAYYHVATVDGRLRWLRLSANYGEALRKWAELEGAQPEQRWTVGMAIAHYLEVSGKRLRPATMANYAEGAKKLIPVFGAMAIEDLRRDHVYRYMVERGNVAANRERALLSAVYTHLLNSGLMRGENPAAGLRFRNPEKTGKRYVTDDEFRALLAAASLRMRPLLRLAYITGMRQADILALQLTNATEDGILYVQSKTGEDHLIGWSDELREVWRAAAGMRIGKVPLFLARGGEAYTSSGFKASWRRVKLRAGLPDVKFHDLRRKAASDTDVAHAQELLGHADARVTKRHYRAKIVPVKPGRGV